MSIYLIILNMSMRTWSRYEKNGAPGAQDEKWSGECCDVDDEMMIPWLNMDRRMDTQSSLNGEWKFGEKAYI